MNARETRRLPSWVVWQTLPVEHRIWTEAWAADFLAGRFTEVDAIELLKGGSWSTAFGFRSGGQRFVLRLGVHPDDYRRDQLASRWAGPRLPIPKVLTVEPLPESTGWIAISERHDGNAIDGLPQGSMSVALESLFTSLDALQRVALPGTGYGIWDGPSGDAPSESWSGYLLSTRDRDDLRLAGWRDALSQYPDVERLFFDGFEQLEEATASLPSLRCVVHSDLLYGNVLVDRANQISAVLDWGCSLAGDPVYDAAWLRVWAPWHPGIDPSQVTQLAQSVFGEHDLEHRMRTYEMHILLAGIQYQAFAHFTKDMHDTARTLRSLLFTQRGGHK